MYYTKKENYIKMYLIERHIFMKTLISRFRWIGIILGVLLILAGGTVMGISIAIACGAIDGNIITIILSITAAVLFFIVGAIYLAAGLTTSLSNFFDQSFLFGSLCIAFGVVLLLERNEVANIVIYLISIALICIGGIYLIRAVQYIVYKYDTLKVVLAFIIATIAIVFGILALVLKDKLFIGINIAIGALIIAAGVVQIIATAKGKY